MNDGGRAFPRPCSEANGDKGEMWNDSEPGMSLRDYFAAHASESDIIESKFRIRNSRTPKNDNPITNSQARYFHADQMLKARA